VTITVSPGSVVFEDDGVGFDPDSVRDGHGVADSIVGRMRRAGGNAVIRSASGAGTRTELSWFVTHSTPQPLQVDPDQMIHRGRVSYGLALTAYAVANLFVMSPSSFVHEDHPAVQVTLAVAALVSTLTAVTGIRRERWRARALAAVALAVVTIAQPLAVPVSELGGQHHWAQGSVGWCLLPLVFGMSAPLGAGLLVVYWALQAAVMLIRDPSTMHLVNIGLGTASILTVQLFALVFNGLMRDAAADAQAETDAHQRLIRGDRVAQALRVEYQHRYADLVEHVVPLLKKLAAGGPVDDDLRRTARAESRRLRALFDQATAFDHPLIRRLQPIIDNAAARHVDVTVDITDELPELTDDEIDGMLQPVARVLQAATSTARVVVCATTEQCSVSVVCDHISCVDELYRDLASAGTADAHVVTTDASVWVLLRRQLVSESSRARPLQHDLRRGSGSRRP
jgi:hypothetical protein